MDTRAGIRVVVAGVVFGVLCAWRVPEAAARAFITEPPAAPAEAEPVPAEPAAKLPADLASVVKLLCEHYRGEAFAERVRVSYTSPGKREQQSTVVVRSAGAGASNAAGAGPELLVEVGPLLVSIRPDVIAAVPLAADGGRPIYWATPVVVAAAGVPAPARLTLPTHSEIARLLAPLPLPQLALMDPDAARKFLLPEGIPLLIQLPGAQAQAFTAEQAAIAGRAQIAAPSNPTVTSTVGWTMTLFPESAQLRSLNAAYLAGTLQLTITPLKASAVAASHSQQVSTAGRRRVAELAELARTIAPVAPDEAPMALGEVGISNPTKLSGGDGAASAKTLAELLAAKTGAVVLLVHRPTLDASKSAVLAAREALGTIEKTHPGRTVVVRLPGAEPVLDVPESVLGLSSQQVDRLVGDHEAVLVVVSGGPVRTVLGSTGVLPGQRVGVEAIAKLSQLLEKQ